MPMPMPLGEQRGRLDRLDDAGLSTVTNIGTTVPHAHERRGSSGSLDLLTPKLVK